MVWANLMVWSGFSGLPPPPSKQAFSSSLEGRREEKRGTGKGQKPPHSTRQSRILSLHPLLWTAHARYMVDTCTLDRPSVFLQGPVRSPQSTDPFHRTRWASSVSHQCCCLPTQWAAQVDQSRHVRGHPLLMSRKITIRGVSDDEGADHLRAGLS